MQSLKDFLVKAGLQINKVPADMPTRLNHLVCSLYPKYDVPLIRLGSDSDSGYLVPTKELIPEINFLLSPGVDDKIRFESEFSRIYNSEVLMIDPSPLSSEISSNIDFKGSYEQAFLVPHLITNTGVPQITLDHALTKVSKTLKHKALQMDIEGGEYSILISASDHLLNSFDLIIIEFHYLSHYISGPAYAILRDCLNKLSLYFTPVHTHANNYTPIKLFARLECPDCLEVTFVNKKLLSSSSFPDKLKIYHNLDRPCAPFKPECYLNSWDRMYSKLRIDNSFKSLTPGVIP